MKYISNGNLASVVCTSWRHRENTNLLQLRKDKYLFTKKLLLEVLHCCNIIHSVTPQPFCKPCWRWQFPMTIGLFILASINSSPPTPPPSFFLVIALFPSLSLISYFASYPLHLALASLSVVSPSHSYFLYALPIHVIPFPLSTFSFYFLFLFPLIALFLPLSFSRSHSLSVLPSLIPSTLCFFLQSSSYALSPPLSTIPYLF